MPYPKPPPGHFSILYFASATAFTKKTSEFLQAPLPITELFNLLDKKYPGIKHGLLLSSAVTVNLDYVDVEQDDKDSGVDSHVDTFTIKEGDEVAIIPPVSSG